MVSDLRGIKVINLKRSANNKKSVRSFPFGFNTSGWGHPNIQVLGSLSLCVFAITLRAKFLSDMKVEVSTATGLYFLLQI